MTQSSDDFIFIDSFRQRARKYKPVFVLLLQQIFHGLQLREMLTHICMKDHFNNQVAEFTEVSLLHVVENIAVVFLHHPNINRCSTNRFSIAYSRVKYYLLILFSLLLIRFTSLPEKGRYMMIFEYRPIVVQQG